MKPANTTGQLLFGFVPMDLMPVSQLCKERSLRAGSPNGSTIPIGSISTEKIMHRDISISASHGKRF